MYNSLPGAGLGRRPSSLLAYGLGTSFVIVADDEIAVVYGGGGYAAPGIERVKLPERVADELRDVYEDDEEVFEILLSIIVSKVLN